MKYMLLIASAVTLAVASPTRGLIDPGAAGPAPVLDPDSIAVGPAILDFEPIAIGPALVDSYEPVVPAPAPVEDITGPVAPAPIANPVVQIILNLNGQVSVPGIVVPDTPTAVAPDPVHVVDTAPEPVDIGAPVLAPEPVIIGTPVLPEPAVILPEELN